MLKIISYDFCKEEEIDIVLKDGHVLVLNRKQYELFLQVEHKLEYVLDYCEAGEHKQREASLSFEEYWNYDDETIKNDIVEFIKTRIL